MISPICFFFTIVVQVHACVCVCTHVSFVYIKAAHYKVVDFVTNRNVESLFLYIVLFLICVCWTLSLLVDFVVIFPLTFCFTNSFSCFIIFTSQVDVWWYATSPVLLSYFPSLLWEGLVCIESNHSLQFLTLLCSACV